MKLPAACPAFNGHELYGIRAGKCSSTACDGQKPDNDWSFCDECTAEMREEQS